MTMEKELPEGWVNTELGEIIKISSGKSLPKSKMQEGEIPVYGGNGVTGVHNDGNVSEKTIVIGRVGFYCGSIHLTPKSAWVTDNAFITSYSKANISRSFLFYLLINTNLRQDDSSTAQPVISGIKVYPLKVLLPPLAEQQVIADQLDNLLAQVATTKTRLERVPETIKRFRQSVLAAAVSGKLTKGCESWENVNLEKVASHIVDCPHSTPKWSENGKYCVRTTAFNPFFLDLSKQGVVNESVFEERVQRLRPEGGDILYSREGTVGIACQIPNDVELCLGQRMVLIRSGNTCDPRYLTIVLNSDLILSIVRSKTIGSTAPRVNMKDIKNYPIPLPPLPEQQEIVRRVEELFAHADAVEQQAKAALEKVNNLTQSILAKAFRGELTADWRAANPELISGENSAEALLERIKEERAAQKPKKRATTRRKKKVVSD